MKSLSLLSSGLSALGPIRESVADSTEAVADARFKVGVGASRFLLAAAFSALPGCADPYFGDDMNADGCEPLEFAGHGGTGGEDVLVIFSLDGIQTSASMDALLADNPLTMTVSRLDAAECYTIDTPYESPIWTAFPYRDSLEGSEWMARLTLSEEVLDTADVFSGQGASCLGTEYGPNDSSVPEGNSLWVYVSDPQVDSTDYYPADIDSKGCNPSFILPE